MVKTKKGFTLIELMVAMGIVAVLVGLSIFGIQTVQRNLRNTERQSVVNDLRLEIQSYFNENGSYPTTNQVVLSSTNNTMSIVDGAAVFTRNLEGATVPAATTSASATAYCYSSTGGTYSLAFQTEVATGAGGWEQLGNQDSGDCASALPVQ